MKRTRSSPPRVTAMRNCSCTRVGDERGMNFRNEQCEKEQGAGQDPQHELPILPEIVHSREHGEHLSRQRLHPTSRISLPRERIVFPDLHLLLQRLDLFCHSLHQRDAAEGGAEPNLPGQLPRHPQVLHVVFAAKIDK